MPSLVINRFREFSFSPSYVLSMSLYYVVVSVYTVGGLMFLIGSIFSLPSYGQYANVGNYLFLLGSILFTFTSINGK